MILATLSIVFNFCLALVCRSLVIRLHHLENYLDIVSDDVKNLSDCVITEGVEND